MPVYVAMLRGINVSGHKIIKMEALRAMFETMGLGAARTYIQSGNVLFEASKNAGPTLAPNISEKIRAQFGFDVSVQVRSAAELAEVCKKNPLLDEPAVDAARLYVTFLPAPAPAKAAERLQPLAAKADRFAVCGREIFLFCPGGYGGTKFSNNAIEKKLSVPATTRNWKTVGVLCEMARQ
jgi:uncharacterized protein (DUF1697 family)